MEQSKPYHHGTLREALVEAAEVVLRRDGLPSLTLRAIAREAGVSHGAPAHHFKTLSELLTELAAVGSERLASMLEQAVNGPDWRHAAGHAYLNFAIENPGLFALMFRSELLDVDNPRLRAAVARRFVILKEIGSNPDVAEDGMPLGAMAALWGLVHGFAVLAIDGRLAPLLRVAPEGTDTSALLDLALGYITQQTTRRIDELANPTDVRQKRRPHTSGRRRP